MVPFRNFCQHLDGILSKSEENISEMVTVSEKKRTSLAKIVLMQAAVSFCDNFQGCRRGSLQ